jgi:hypothetical protein
MHRSSYRKDTRVSESNMNPCFLVKSCLKTFQSNVMVVTIENDPIVLDNSGSTHGDRLRKERLRVI